MPGKRKPTFGQKKSEILQSQMWDIRMTLRSRRIKLGNVLNDIKDLEMKESVLEQAFREALVNEARNQGN